LPAAPPQDPHRVVSVPASDTLFRHTVDRHVEAVRQRGATLRAARRSLRQRYPAAELSRQRDCGIRGRSVELWFAFRDGKSQALAPEARWWEGDGLARAAVDGHGRLTATNAVCRRLLDLGPDRSGPIRLRHLMSAELYQELALESKRRPADSAWAGSLPLRLPSGRRLEVEFHARADPARRRFDVALRSLRDRDLANDWMAMGQSAIGTMPTAVRTELVRGGTRRTLGSGERLATSVTDDAWVVLVTAGIIRLYVAMDGHEPTLAYGTRGSLFGTHAMAPSDSFLVGLQSVTPSVVLVLSARRVRELAATHAAFARALSVDAQLQLHQVIRSFTAHAAGNLRQRLAREITVLAELQADDELVPVTEQQLADGVGSIRESIGRTIGDLRRDGCIATTRHGLLVLDKGRLRTLGRAGLD
jgi:CRP-like cAMP-binding protein